MSSVKSVFANGALSMALLLSSCSQVSPGATKSIYSKSFLCQDLRYDILHEQITRISVENSLAISSRQDGTDSFIFELRDSRERYVLSYVFGLASIGVYLLPSESKKVKDQNDSTQNIVIQRMEALFSSCRETVRN